ncbi:MAG: DNA-directed RNA polymerase subunit omega [Candidatus Omnitrophica bacterium]|nr:DNA-directed RNA polymerase subunit omega [Candidatus Omnitrophota bacterium]MCK5179609.1 DNA-directed RNA polymerase subunit omega [Candidatus Omnitrophota bacterium]MCK5259880.1 DNA-directed RNA polymerase subunit omega [Candidatus Omnitrophota bacterium]
MSDLPIEELLPRAKHSIYKLVRMASTRALELSDGGRCLAENITTEKFTTMALEEIAQGKIILQTETGGKALKEESPEDPQEEDKDEYALAE